MSAPTCHLCGWHSPTRPSYVIPDGDRWRCRHPVPCEIRQGERNLRGAPRQLRLSHSPACGPFGPRHDCVCPDCREHRSRKSKRAKRLRQQGRPTTVSAAPLIPRLTRAVDDGHTLFGIARKAGVPSSTVYWIVSGERPTLRRSTFDAIAGTLDSLGDPQYVSVERAQLVARALAVNGWRIEDMAAAVDMPGLAGALHGKHAGGRIRFPRWASLTRWADTVRDTPGPSPLTAAVARNRGWQGPDVFDESWHLIPDVMPEQPYDQAVLDALPALDAARELYAGGYRTEAVRWLLDRGWSVHRVTVALGVSGDTVARLAAGSPMPARPSALARRRAG